MGPKGVLQLTHAGELDAHAAIHELLTGRADRDHVEVPLEDGVASWPPDGVAP